MGRERDPVRDKALKLYLKNNGNIKLTDIAERVGKSDVQIRKWKKADDWEKHLEVHLSEVVPKKALNQQIKKVRTQIEQENKSTLVENQNGKSDSQLSVLPKKKFATQRDNAAIHGLRRKYLYPEQVELLEMVEDLDLSDMLWMQIEICFATIVRAQKIMWVEDKFDGMKGIDRDVFAYEVYESLVKAQSRAMTEFRGMVKQFLEVTDQDDERRKKLDMMQLNIEKAKAEVAKLNNDNNKQVAEITIVDAWGNS